jgi:hypothetical protein
VSRARASLPRRSLPQRKDIEGAWAYHHWRITYDDGRITEPFGADASGLLLYTADGFMSACIMAGGRPPFASPNPRAATLRERAGAFDGYFSYAGRWRLVRGVVEHVVSIAANPAMVGTSQFRNARLSGRRLVLSAEETTARGLRRHELEWRRPSPRGGRRP